MDTFKETLPPERYRVLREAGTWIIYHSNGKKASETEYKDGTPTGVRKK
ncbi:hypothetical protein JXB02_05195 [Candidatus Woesearchaeota archaeon]|nr:hypothetical protein [Candidatus Woesearchaeota archaeon]